MEPMNRTYTRGIYPDLEAPPDWRAGMEATNTTKGAPPEMIRTFKQFVEAGMEPKTWLGIVRYDPEKRRQEAHLVEVDPEQGRPEDVELAVKFEEPDFSSALGEFRRQWNKYLHRKKLGR